jgi:5-formyltetrahydrofolate cyclo-ligase
MESKKDIRKRVLEKRNCIPDKEWEDKSRLICEKVVTHPFFLQADAIYCYVDYRHEVGTRGIIEYAWSSGKRIAVPKVNGDKMEFYYIQSYEDLKEGYKGILEPEGLCPAKDENALIIMPGAAFDKCANRIGYGKGYYDKYLQFYTNHKTIALAFELQMVDVIPADTHDICPNIIITEENTYERQLTK